MVYRRVYKSLAWVFFGVGAGLALIGVIVGAALHVDTSELLRMESDGAAAAVALCLTGLPFLIIAVVFAIIAQAARRREDSLRASGNKIEAPIDSIGPLYNYGYNRSNAFIITCRWEGADDGRVYVYRSEMLSFDPTGYLAEHGIKTMTIYLDRYNPKRYYMDVTAITKRVVIA
ncbi:hypothetical protein AGMMS49992_01990 [Clostridia bacterium]|nr:hypothetical protein AGMMS49992_01990 [Clostridia bacterium]